MSQSSTNLPTLKWGIIGTGFISAWFVQDLLLTREDAKAKHIIHAVGSSSLPKGNRFVEEQILGKSVDSTSPKVYGSYNSVYNDSEVDIVYIGLPHSMHKAACLAAIEQGKHILCEKAFTLNADDARDIFAAADAKGCYVMEGMWTRFFPLIDRLQEVLYSKRAIGNIHRAFADFGLRMDIESLGPESRLRNPALGAGSLLDIGIYAMTWGIIALEDLRGGNQEQWPKPQIAARQSLFHGVDLTSSFILHYPENGRQAICTSTTLFKTGVDFCRIEGSEGYIVVSGLSSANPTHFTVIFLDGRESERHSIEKKGRGFYWEADAAALDVAAGRKESSVMPWKETIRVLEMLDEIRRQNGTEFPSS